MNKKGAALGVGDRSSRPQNWQFVFDGAEKRFSPAKKRTESEKITNKNDAECVVKFRGEFTRHVGLKS